MDKLEKGSFMNRSPSENPPSTSTQKSLAPKASRDLYDARELKQQAEKSLEDGAVTENYALDVQQACQLLNEALATEIVCVLRYRHHQIIARGINYLDIADEFREHAENEEKHMLMLAERINQLGGDPDFNPATIMQRSVAEYGTGRDLVSLIRENLVSERIVIDVYRKMIEWFGLADPTTRRVLEKILGDEEEHANELAELLAATPSSH
jgi:bacterioferritin